ncbi:MAG: ABC transporter substrate-binding protein [Rhodospirillaceae bacterium]|nr:ABC transporter substrate-binding protein [Rhodospirillaceae bacterium]
MSRLKLVLMGLSVLAVCTTAAAMELRYGSKGLPVSFGNPFTANGSPSNYVWLAMFDGLTQLDVAGQLQPALATDWELVNPTTWRFKLRAGVTFTNGEPLTAEAVVATVAWLKTPAGRGTIIGNEMRDILSAEREDDLTVLVRTARPDAILPRRLSAMPIVAPKAWAELGVDGFAKTPATTGSFAVKDWGEGSGRVVLEAFKQSWRPPVALERLIIINLPDNAARMQALQSGQIDIAGNIGVDDIDAVEMIGGKLISAPSWSVLSIGFRITDKPGSPLGDVRVRQALNYAVDKQAMTEVLLRGLTVPSGQPASKGATGYDEGIPAYPYDPAKAKALLAEAGYAQGFPLKFEVMVDRTPGDAAVFQTTSEALSKLGIKVELRSLTFASWFTKYLSGSWDADTDGFTLAWNAAPYNDVARPMEIYSCIKQNPFFCDPALTARLEAAGEEMDLVKREALLKVLARDYRDAAPALFFYDVFDLFGVAKGVEGVEIVNRVPVYHKISKTKS